MLSNRHNKNVQIHFQHIWCTREKECVCFVVVVVVFFSCVRHLMLFLFFFFGIWTGEVNDFECKEIIKNETETIQMKNLKCSLRMIKKMNHTNHNNGNAFFFFYSLRLVLMLLLLLLNCQLQFIYVYKYIVD